jgi:hypothetical protein
VRPQPPIRRVLADYPRLSLERLPASSPKLNPAEWVWGWAKHGKMANSVPESMEDEVTEHLFDLKHDSKLLRSLWAGSDLPFPATTSSRCCPEDQ